MVRNPATKSSGASPTVPLLLKNPPSTTELFYFSDGGDHQTPAFPDKTYSGLQDENAALRKTLIHVSAERDYLHIRKEVYKKRALKQENYMLSLESLLPQGPQPNPWRGAAMKAYGLLTKRDRRIEELEKELREAKLQGSQ
jgi:hypothetical protein